MTTIPPRFKAIIPTLISWCQQDVEPHRVYIFVPKVFKRFTPKKNQKKKENGDIITSAQSLITNIRTEQSLSARIDNGFIQVIEVEKDWGPITRFVGAMEVSEVDQSHSTDYWLIGDDDVYYSSNTIAKYQHELAIKQQLSSTMLDRSRLLLSQFITDYRVAIPNANNFENYDKNFNQIITTFVNDGNPLSLEQRGKLQILKHIQAVDTYLFPSQRTLRIGESQDYYGIDDRTESRTTAYQFNFTSTIITKAISFFHKTCPESYYQDDYIMSFLFHVLGFQVISIWNNDKLAQHVDHVSKSNFQMHMSQEVFMKEDMTKSCISTFASDVIRLIQET